MKLFKKELISKFMKTCRIGYKYVSNYFEPYRYYSLIFLIPIIDICFNFIANRLH